MSVILYYVKTNEVALRGGVDEMIFEIVSTAVMGGIALKAHMSKTGVGNDSNKLQKIFTVSGLNVRDGKQTYTTQLVKRKVYDWGVEYRYKLPLGRSFEDYQARFRAIEQGLNTRSVQWKLKDIRELKLDKTIFNQIKNLYSRKLTARKEVELIDDNFLIIRVYNEPMTTELPWESGVDWKVPVGVQRNKNEKVMLDFEKIPHIVLGGATRYGKSNFINSLICSLLTSQPENVHFHLIDLKGGVELCDYENIKQTVSIAYEPEEALNTLQKAYDSMRATQKRLRAMNKKKVQDAGIKERHFIIIDEVGELNPAEAVTKEEKKLKEECQTLMSKIARLGAGLGFRQILATQYPTGDVIPRQCKQNSDGKLCFKVQSGTASRVVLDGEGAEKLPDVKGRAIWQTPTKKLILQTPLINSEVIQQATSSYIEVKTTKEDTHEAETLEPTPRVDSVIIEETRFS
jgi:DNA segregation ATPase FtsK/SpoIIIE, S-DNA-T family